MMQQVASVKSESAASVLPLNVSTTNGSKQAFNEALSAESQRVSAFTEARNRADGNASNQPQRAQSNNEHGADKASLTTANTQQHNSKENNASEQTSGAAQSGKPPVSQSENASDSVSEKQGINNSKNSPANTSENLNANATQNTSEDKSNAITDDAQLGDDNAHVVLNSDQKENGEFDYVTYITQLAAFTGNAEGSSSSDNNAASDVIDTESVLLSNTDSELISLPSEEVILEIPLEGDSAEFVTVSLNKEALQLILDAQNAQLDLNAPLSDEDTAKLNSIIASMLNQLDQQNSSSGDTHDAIQMKEADRALLTNLLLNKNNTAEQAVQQLSSTESVGHVDKADAEILDVAKKQLLSSEKSASMINPSAQGSADGSAEAKTPLKAEMIDAANPLDAAQSTVKSSNELASTKVNEASVKQPADTQKTPLLNLAALSEEQSVEAIKNISERVQSIISELKNPAKGSEFVAAMQAGVKEFKQQLASGREPGMDLKALIADAIASTNTDVSTSTQPKIDAALNQFNAVLNLANAINYSATQQQAQVLGITDNQFAKEMNVLQTEGTKLANAVNNQLNAQANSDKAINIFKAEGQQQLAEKVRWMVNAKNPSAEIRLDPPDLGGINIKVNLSGDVAQVNFSVQSVAAKEALDQAVPRLRDMLSQQGIELGQSSVQQDSQQQAQQGEQDTSSFSQSPGSGMNNDALAEQIEESHGPVIEQNISNGALGGIDHYA